jgi:GT2 family glycosyltransferase
MHKLLPNIAVITPNWNGLDYLEECLDSLERQTQAHTVIMVDNGSTDGSLELARAKFPSVQIHAFPNNAGFAGGVNRGIKPALEQGFDYMALLNNDAVAQPDWLERLVATAEAHSETGIVTSKIKHFDDPRLDSTGDFYSTWGFPFPRGRDEDDQGQYDGAEQRVVFGASGGASLYRADMLRQIGLFDERFFAYYEDVDISFRAQLAGWKVRYEPAAVVLHHIGGTSRRANSTGQSTDQAITVEAGAPSPFARYHSVKNFAYLYTKDMPGRLYWKYLPRWWASWAMMVASDLKRGLVLVNIKGNFIALWHMPGILIDRYHIQRRRKVSLSYIDSILYHDLPPLQKLRFRRFRKRSATK